VPFEDAGHRVAAAMPVRTLRVWHVHDGKRLAVPRLIHPNDAAAVFDRTVE
jgi:hypothetical protein